MRLGRRWRKDMADEKIARTELPSTVVAVPAATAAMRNHPAKATCMSKERPSGGEAVFYFDRNILNRRDVAGEQHDKYNNGASGNAFSKDPTKSTSYESLKDAVERAGKQSHAGG